MIPEVKPKTFVELLREWTVFHPVVAGVAFLFVLVLFVLLVVRCCLCYTSSKQVSAPPTRLASRVSTTSQAREVKAVQLPDGQIISKGHASVLDTVFSVNSGPGTMSNRFWAALGRADPKAHKQE